ncbi:mitochondrial GTPase 1-like isoform X2 [Ornithodoros turicata]
MASKVQGAALAFRKTFTFPSKDLTRWYPQHMYTGMKDMQRKLKSVDCILELHDARVPFSGRNPNFSSRLTAVKPHVLLLNKMDMAHSKYDDVVISQLKSEGISNVLYIKSTQPHKNIGKIVPLVTDLIKKSDRYNRREAYDYNIMIIGIPNVGKSSLINALRHKYLQIKGQATRVGALAGVTKSVLMKIKISEDPLIYLLDTPGIMTPSAQDAEVGLKLALCGNMNDNLVGVELMADYLLYWLNKNGNYSYTDYLGLEEPCDDIRLVLYKTAVALRATLKVRTYEGLAVKPDLDAAATHFVLGFRQGIFGRVVLDVDKLQLTEQSCVESC